MATPVYPTGTVVTWAKISEYLANLDISKNRALKYGSYDTRLDTIMYLVRKSVEWRNNNFPSDTTLGQTTNYLFNIIGKYWYNAKAILDANNGGIIINPNTGMASTIQAFHFEWVVGATGSPLNNGDTTYVISLADVIPNSVSLEMPQDNVPMNQTDQFSYQIAYTPQQVTFLFMNDAGSGNMGVQNGMYFIFRGLYYVNI